MADKCMHRIRNGSFCKRWASEGSRFCSHHQGSTAHLQHAEALDLHPLARLTTPEDVFDVLRETLNAARLGRISPGQAYAVAHVASQWHKFYQLLSARQRETALHRQMLPDLLVEETRLEAEQAEAPHPLPVRVDTEAAVLHDTLDQSVPAPPLISVADYPGWIEKHGRRKGDRVPQSATSPDAAAPAASSPSQVYPESAVVPAREGPPDSPAPLPSISPQAHPEPAAVPAREGPPPSPNGTRRRSHAPPAP